MITQFYYLGSIHLSLINFLSLINKLSILWKGNILFYLMTELSLRDGNKYQGIRNYGFCNYLLNLKDHHIIEIESKSLPCQQQYPNLTHFFNSITFNFIHGRISVFECLSCWIRILIQFSISESWEYYRQINQMGKKNIFSLF